MKDISGGKSVGVGVSYRRRHATGDRRQETGDRRQETGDGQKFSSVQYTKLLKTGLEVIGRSHYHGQIRSQCLCYNI